MGLKKVLRDIIINSMLLCFHELFLQFYFVLLLRNFSCIDIAGLLKSICDLSIEKKPNPGKTIITEMGYHPANDADNLVTRKLSASKPLELKASVLHTLLLTNGASVKKVPKLAGFLSTT